jgi:protein-L-isoaspartate O-methyltransferase
MYKFPDFNQKWNPLALLVKVPTTQNFIKNLFRRGETNTQISATFRCKCNKKDGMGSVNRNSSYDAITVQPLFNELLGGLE